MKKKYRYLSGLLFIIIAIMIALIPKNPQSIPEIFYGDYARSKYNLQTFYERYAEAHKSKIINSNFLGDYAASNYSLSSYIERYEKILKSDIIKTNDPGSYAGAPSGVTLQTYMNRYDEINNSRQIYHKFYTDYASSTISLEKFIERLNLAKNSKKIEMPYWGSFAASNYSIDKFTKRIKEFK